MNKDMVENPAHYTHGGIECIDAIEAALGRDGFIAFLRGQVIRYQWRLGHKDSAEQDAAKARWYAVKLEEVLSAFPGGNTESGWMGWVGGIIAPLSYQKVDIKLRGGNIVEGVKPSEVFWVHKGVDTDVVAFRESKNNSCHNA